MKRSPQSPLSPRRNPWDRRFILILALALTAITPILAWAVTDDAQVFRRNDSATYIKPAKSLMEEGRFFDEGLPKPGLELEKTRNPAPQVKMRLERFIANKRDGRQTFRKI